MLLLTTLFVTSSIFARECWQVSQEGAPISIIVNHRPLAGDELRLYLEASTNIDTCFKQQASTFDLEVLKRLLAALDCLPSVVSEDSKDCLRNRIEDQLLALVRPRDVLLRDLLSSENPSLEHMASWVLLNQNTKEWFADRKLRRLLKAKLNSRQTEPTVRIDIVYLFGYAGAFPKVRGLALRLAQDEGLPELARGAGEVLCWRLIMDHDYAGLGDLFRSSAGILKQQAALALASWDNPDVEPGLKGELSSELIDIVLDKQLPSVTRGEAIEACERVHDDARVVSTLLLMLDPENWFVGVRGMHAPTHSLVPVIKVLSAVDQSENTRVALTELKSQLGRLDPSDRKAVEYEMKKILN